MEINDIIAEITKIVRETTLATVERTQELIFAPLNNQDMLWSAIPLLIATLFMILYFARYKKEELGWNTAFGNTMIFVFVAIGIIREMYEQGNNVGNLINNELYLLLSIGLTGCGVMLMFFTYFHLLPKRFAFFMLSAPPINVSAYVVMAMVYADVEPGLITVLSATVLLVLILVLGKILSFVLKVLGLEYIENMVVAGGLAEKPKRRSP